MLISVFTHFPLCLDRDHFGVFVTWSLGKKRNKRMCVIYDIWPKSNSFSFYLMRIAVQFKKNTFTSINIVHIASQVQHVTCWNNTQTWTMHHIAKDIQWDLRSHVLTKAGDKQTLGCLSYVKLSQKISCFCCIIFVIYSSEPTKAEYKRKSFLIMTCCSRETKTVKSASYILK